MKGRLQLPNSGSLIALSASARFTPGAYRLFFQLQFPELFQQFLYIYVHAYQPKKR
jgi:hypothetical protein